MPSISPPDPMVGSWRDSPFWGGIWGDDFIIHNRRDQDFRPYIHTPTHQSPFFAGHMTTGWTFKNQSAPILYKNWKRIPLLLLVQQHVGMGTHCTWQAYTVYLHDQNACPCEIWHYTKAFLRPVAITHLSKKMHRSHWVRCVCGTGNQKPCNVLRYVLYRTDNIQIFCSKAGKSFIANVNLALFTL